MAAKRMKIVVIGYGSQGRAIALNLQDSGHDVTVALRKGSKTWAVAKRDKIKSITPVADAVSQCNIVMFAFPDHQHRRSYEQVISQNLPQGATLVFLHGMSVHFGFVVPPRDADVILLAPHAPGVAVREQFLGERSISAFYAIHQNRSKKALATLHALAAGIGIQKKRLIKTTFEYEAVGDLFGEQAILCGGMAALIKNGFEVLTESGIPADNAYLEVAYQLDLIVKLVKQHGIQGMLDRISVAARVGSLLAGPRLIDLTVKQRMRDLLAEVKSGQFPKTLDQLSDQEIAQLTKSLAKLTTPQFEKSARKFAPK